MLIGVSGIGKCMWLYFTIKHIKTYHDEVVSGGPSSSFMQTYMKDLSYMTLEPLA